MGPNWAQNHCEGKGLWLLLLVLVSGDRLPVTSNSDIFSINCLLLSFSVKYEVAFIFISGLF